MKKLLSVTLIALLALSLAACGAPNAPASTSTPGPADASEAPIGIIQTPGPESKTAFGMYQQCAAQLAAPEAAEYDCVVKMAFTSETMDPSMLAMINSAMGEMKINTKVKKVGGELIYNIETEAPGVGAMKMIMNSTDIWTTLNGVTTHQAIAEATGVDIDKLNVQMQELSESWIKSQDVAEVDGKTVVTIIVDGEKVGSFTEQLLETVKTLGGEANVTMSDVKYVLTMDSDGNILDYVAVMSIDFEIQGEQMSVEYQIGLEMKNLNGDVVIEMPPDAA